MQARSSHHRRLRAGLQLLLAAALTTPACDDSDAPGPRTSVLNVVAREGFVPATAAVPPTRSPGSDPAPFNARPELGPIPWQRIGRGQRVSFGLNVVDAESDVVAVALTAKPTGAVYRPLTLTVVWEPTVTDGDRGEFEVRITETIGPRAIRRVTTFRFSIAVTDLPQPPPLLLSPEVAEVGALITFTDPQRLERAAATVPLSRLLKDELGLSEHDFLAELARAHRNPALDPTSRSFDPAWKLDRWSLVGVRIRPGPWLPGASLIYRAAAPEDAFVRVRFGAHSRNAIASMIRDRFLEGSRRGGVREEMADAAAHAAAIEAAVAHILDPDSGFRVLVLDHAARAGAGTERDSEGGYVSGDGWGFGRFEALPEIVTTITASADGLRWGPRCAPRYREGTSGFVVAAAALCSPHGLVAVEAEGAPGTRARVDTTAGSRSFRAHATAETPADDLRRLLFGDIGMTCTGCHTRAFDVGGRAALRPVMEEASASPSLPRPAGIARTFFVVVAAGVEAGPAYLRALETYELCQLRASLARIGYEAEFPCPLGEVVPEAER